MSYLPEKKEKKKMKFPFFPFICSGRETILISIRGESGGDETCFFTGEQKTSRI
jgi:hypothetical protein